MFERLRPHKQITIGDLPEIGGDLMGLVALPVDSTQWAGAQPHIDTPLGKQLLEDTLDSFSRKRKLGERSPSGGIGDTVFGVSEVEFEGLSAPIGPDREVLERMRLCIGVAAMLKMTQDDEIVLCGGSQPDRQTIRDLSILIGLVGSAVNNNREQLVLPYGDGFTEGQIKAANRLVETGFCGLRHRS